MASDLGTPPRSRLGHIYVNVTGGSGGVPQFSEEVYEVQVLSNTPVGNTVFVASAGRGNFLYSIVSKYRSYVIK